MKISQLTTEILIQYLRLPVDEENSQEVHSELELMLLAANSYVLSYTGLTQAQAENLEDLSLALMVLVADMYTNRSFTVESGDVNRVVQSILDMHRVNLIG